MAIHLGGFQEVAHHLTKTFGKSYSRQAIQALWERRLKNGFPEMEEFTINGHTKKYFLLADVTRWYRNTHVAKTPNTAITGTDEHRQR
jgi:hypothetical protein